MTLPLSAERVPEAEADRAGPPIRRVAFLVNHYPQISEVFIANAAAGLARAGVVVDIVAVWGLAATDAPFHAVERELAAHPLVRITGPRHPYYPLGRRVFAPAAVARLLATRGPGALRRVLTAARQEGGTRLLAQAAALGRGPYDAVHCQFATLAPLALRMRRAGVLRGPVVVHFRGYDITRVVQEQGADVYADVFREADGFVANCRAFADRAVALGCDAARLAVISSGCDLAAFPFVPRRPPDSARELGMVGVGRLVEKKGFIVAVEAMHLLRERGVPLRLTLIGEGPERGALEAAVARYGLETQVSLLGALPHSAIARHLAAADVLLAPSLTASNGDADAPVNTVKEAMATGLPVIASRHGGIPEIVQDGVNGWLAEENDPADLARCIARWAATPDRWEAVGSAGRETVERHHSLEHATRLTLAAYRAAARRAAA